MSRKKYNGRIKYSPIPFNESDEYIITTLGDRLDSLAHHYYNGRTNLWKLIYIANNSITKGSLFPQPGIQLRIPTDENVIKNFLKELENVDIQSTY